MTEIDRLALARRVYVEHARASKGNIQEEWVGDIMAGEADHLHGVQIAARAIDTLLTDIRTVLAYESGQERLRGLLSGLTSRSDAVAAIDAEMDKANQYVAAGCGGEKNIARAILAAINALPAVETLAAALPSTPSGKD